jgi:hypothetical protein
MKQEIINSSNGHYWIFNPTIQKHQIHWKPITNVYSPPQFLPNIKVVKISYKDEIPINLLIGKDGFHFKNISRLSNCPYIYFKDDHIEFWGNSESISKAINLFNNHYRHCHKKYIY